MRQTMKKFMLALLCATGSVHAAITVTDDAGNRITLAQPAQRVISMAPHVTELLFAAGGGKRIVGAINYSDFPAEAKSIPTIGSNSQIDMERVIALKPDLVIVWDSGTTARQVQQLASLGVPIYRSEPRRFEQVATSMVRFGQLLGTDAVAERAAANYRDEVARLKKRYGSQPVVPTFYQVWDRPIYTLNGNQIVSDAIGICGGRNVFAALPAVAPEVSVEAVLAQDPEAIVGDEPHGQQDPGIAIWKTYRAMTAVKRGNLFTVHGELLTRPGPRTVLGAAELCEKLEQARQRRR
ncbi:MAG TPA: cobalamin-binding protein [Telluria sp.]|nr:cobalamin-binding protein [Telluria sp.]